MDFGLRVFPDNLTVQNMKSLQQVIVEDWESLEINQ